MRTTVTLDRDVEQLVRDAMRETGQSFKATLNAAVRNGLADMIPAASEEPFVVVPKSMGLRPGIDPAHLQSLGDDLEIDAFLETKQEITRSNKESA